MFDATIAVAAPGEELDRRVASFAESLAAADGCRTGAAVLDGAELLNAAAGAPASLFCTRANGDAASSVRALGRALAVVGAAATVTSELVTVAAYLEEVEQQRAARAAAVWAFTLDAHLRLVGEATAVAMAAAHAREDLGRHPSCALVPRSACADELDRSGASLVVVTVDLADLDGFIADSPVPVVVTPA